MTGYGNGKEKEVFLMSRTKRESYGSISRAIRELLAKQEAEKKRMAEVMASALLDNEAAEKLGEYSDADLRKIMTMVASDIGQYVDRLEAEKQAKKQPVEVAPAPSGEYGQSQQYQDNSNGGWNG